MHQKDKTGQKSNSNSFACPVNLKNCFKSSPLLPSPPSNEESNNQPFKTHFIYLILATACFAVFYPILFNDFQYYWDDQWMVFNEYTEGGLNARNLKKLFMTNLHGQYAPINQFVFLLLYSAVGYKAFFFHLTSLLLHTACVFLVYRCITCLFALSNGILTNRAIAVACITSLIFALHPLNVESVAWMSAIKVLLYAFFYLLATLAFLSFLKKKKFIYYLGALLLFTLSFGCKEQAVTFPLWLLLIYFMLGYDFKQRKVWKSLLPFFLLSFVFGLITMSVSARSEYAMQDLYPVWQRVVFGCYSLVEYLTKFAFPYKLLYIYPFPIAAGEAIPLWLLIYPTLIFIAVVTLKSHLLKKPYLFGILFFLIHIAIALHVIPSSRIAIVADRYMYLAMIGLAFIIAYSLVLAIERWQGWMRKTAILAVACLCLYWGVFSNLRCREWRDSDTLKKEFKEIRKTAKSEFKFTHFFVFRVEKKIFLHY